MADDDDVSTHTGKGSSRHRSITRKLMKRPKSPGAGTVSESDAPSPGPSSRRAASVEVDGGSESEEEEDDDRLGGGRGGGGMSNLGPFANMRRAASEGLESDESERNLAARLALARKNSRNQHETVGAMTLEGPTEETIYEGNIHSDIFITYLDF